MNPILECKGLTRKFNHFFALSNVDLTLERGEIIGLLGPNGSGKTTLIKLINGLILPTDGQITVRISSRCRDEENRFLSSGARMSG